MCFLHQILTPLSARRHWLRMTTAALPVQLALGVCIPCPYIDAFFAPGYLLLLSKISLGFCVIFSLFALATIFSYAINPVKRKFPRTSSCQWAWLSLLCSCLLNGDFRGEAGSSVQQSVWCGEIFSFHILLHHFFKTVGELLFLGCNTQRYLSMRRFGGVLSLRDIVHCLVVYFFLVLLLFLLSQTNQSTTD